MTGLALDAAAVGRRLLLRVALGPDDPGRAQGFSVTDVVGEVLATDGTTARLLTRRGEREVALDDVVAVKELPPAPPRRRPSRPAEALDAADDRAAAP